MNLMKGDPLYALHVNVFFLMLFSKYVSLLMITDGNSTMKLSSTRVLVLQVSTRRFKEYLSEIVV